MFEQNLIITLMFRMASLSLLTAGILLSPLVALAQWSYFGPSASKGWTISNDIAIDSTGAPVIVYHTYADYSSPCLKLEQNQWQQIGAGSYNFPVRDNLKLLIDKQNNYILLYLDSINSFPGVIRFDGNSWNPVGAASVTPELTSDRTIALDTNDRVYCGFSTQSGFQLVRENGNSWEQVTTAGLPIATMGFPDLKFNKYNEPVIAFCNTTTLKACCMKLINGSWVPAGNLNFSTGYAQYLKLLITDENKYYVGFQESYTRVMELNPQTGAWNNAGLPGLGENITGLEDLIADRYGRLFLSTSQVASDKGRCFVYEGSSWMQLGASGISDTTAGYVNIALAKNGDLYATYNDFIAQKAFVKVFQGASSSIETKFEYSVSVFPNPVSDKLQVNFNLVQDAPVNLQLLNMTGIVCKVFETAPDQKQTEIDLEDFDPGIYTLVIQSGRGTKCMKLVKL